MKIRIPIRKKWFVIGCTVMVGFVGYLVWQSQRPTYVKIPASLDDKLLFNPYVVTKLPGGFGIDKDSFKMQETALLFTASNANGQKMVFSEQSVPKNLDMDAFYSSTITSPERLDGLRYKTIFGKLQGRDGRMASVTTEDNTWILVTLPSQATKDDAQSIEQGLLKQ